MAKDKKKGQILKPTNLNASVIKSGILEIARIPPVAIERLITVADQTERFNLTSDDVSTGDTVKQLDINMMYRVQDTDKLDSEDGYTEFMAATYWDNVQSKPSTFPPDTHDHSEATTDSSGFMSNTDKSKLDDVGSMANRDVTISTDSPSGGNDGDIWYQVGS